MAEQYLAALAERNCLRSIESVNISNQILHLPA
jgi:hypothetical protein